MKGQIRVRPPDLVTSRPQGIMLRALCGLTPTEFRLAGPLLQGPKTHEAAGSIRWEPCLKPPDGTGSGFSAGRKQADRRS